MFARKWMATVGVIVALSAVVSLAFRIERQGQAGNGLLGSLDDSPPRDPVTITMTYWASSQLTIDKNNRVIELFEKAYPHIRVKSEYFWGDSYSSKLAVMAATNSLPDVIRIDYSRIASFIGQDLLLPLDGFVESGVIDLKGVDPSYHSGATRNGSLYAVNIGNNALVMFYNPVLLKKAGVEPPGSDYSWDEYEKDMRQIRQRTGAYGDTHLTFRHFQVWLRDHDSTLYNDEQTGLGYEDDGLFARFFEQQLRWQGEDLTSPLKLEQETKSLSTGPFSRGLTAFGSFEYWSNQIDIVEEQLGYPVGLSPYPGSSKGMFIKPSFYHGISNNSEHPEEAALFINFYTFNIEAAKSLNGYFGLPYHPRILESVRDSLTPTQQRVLAYLEQVQLNGTPIDKPEPASGQEISSLFKSVGNEVLFGRITPDEGARRFREQANEILSSGTETY